MDNNLQIILNIVEEYFKILDIFIKSDQVIGSQVVLILIHTN